MQQSNQPRTSTPSTAPLAKDEAALLEQLKAISRATRDASAQDAAQAGRDAAQAGRDAAQQARDAAQAARDAAQLTQGMLTRPAPPSAGFTTQPAFYDPIPPRAVDMAIAFMVMCAVMVIGWPLARAFGKRIERRAESPAINPAVADQLQRIEQAVEAMSIEVERISESQRFMARLQNAQTPGVLPAERS